MARLSENPVSDYFQWPSGISLQIQCSDFPRSLHHEIGAFRRLTPSAATADARVVFCKKKEDLPAAGETLRGRYKGLPWQIVCAQKDKDVPAYFFYAPCFSIFLFVRTCLIPILKKITVERGGFFLIGSAFSLRDTTFILAGNPGSGKTRLLLKGLDSGGVFLGDSELMITADQRVLPVFPYVEARFNTLYGTSHWSALSLQRKAYLLFCLVLSRITFGGISFNLLLDSVDSKPIAGDRSTGSCKRCHLIQLQTDAAGMEPFDLHDFMEKIGDYEAHYEHSFGGGIYTTSLRSRGLSQLKTLLSGASLWKTSSPQGAYDFIQKEMNAHESK